MFSVGRVREQYPAGRDREEITKNASRLTSTGGALIKLSGGVTWFLVAVYPVYFMVITSIRSKSHALAGNFWYPTSNATFANYINLIHSGIGAYFINSIIVTVACVALLVLVSLPAAYAIVRLKSQFIQGLFALFLLGLAIPVQAAIIPIYVMMTKVGLYNTLFALIPPQVAFWIPLSVLIMVNFVRDIPNELYDSMQLDGAGHINMLWNLVLPLSRPAIVAVVLYDGIQVWNNFLFPLVLTQSPGVRTLPLGLQQFQGQYGINVPGLMAAVLVASLPMIFLYILARRQLLSGLTAGFGK